MPQFWMMFWVWGIIRIIPLTLYIRNFTKKNTNISNIIKIMGDYENIYFPVYVLK